MNKIKEKLKKTDVKEAIVRLLPIASLAIVLAVWAIIAKIINMDVILPSPRSAFARLFELFGKNEFWQAVAFTSLRSFTGFGISFILAMIIAVIAYIVPVVGKLLKPIISIIRSIPTMSVILIVIIWISSKLSPVIIAGLIAFPMLFAGFYGALTGIPEDLVKMAKLYKVPIKKRIAKMYIPETLPGIFSTSQGVISLTLKVTISGEVLAQTVGSMGIFMQNARVYLDTALLMAWTIMAVILGFLAELIVLGIKKIIVRG